MSNTLAAAIAWIGLLLHLAAGVAAMRSGAPRPLVPLLNLLTALCILGYWGSRWVGYLTRGVTWYASDQLLPLYALVVAILAAVTLSGRASLTTLHWVLFGIHALALAGAALFLSAFRVNRLF